MMTAKPADLVTISSKSIQSFQSILPHIKAIVKTREMRSIKEITCQIKQLIKDSKITPQQKVFLLDLFHECIMQKVPEFLNYAQEKILERLGYLASKRPADLFRDSRKSKVNLKSSEDFLNNLLNYIQIWARDFGKGAGGLMTYYGTIYLQLKSKGMFHPTKSIVGFGSETEGVAGSESGQDLISGNDAESLLESDESKRLKPRYVRTDKETLDYIDGLLVMIEEIENPSENETGMEIIENIKSLKGNLDEILNRVLNKGDEIGIELTLNISERISRVLEGKKPRGSLYSSMPDKKDTRSENIVGNEKRSGFSAEDKETDLQGQMRDLDFDEERSIERSRTQVASKPAFKSSYNVAPAKQALNIFDDILTLDIEPISNPPPKSSFNTQHIYPIASPPFAGLKDSVPVESQSDNYKFQQEIEKFNQALKEKDEKIALLQSQLESMKLNYDQLLDSFTKTKNALLLKEKESQESHIKKIPPQESQDLQTFDLLFSPLFSVKKAKEPISDNQKLFKCILGEEMGILYDSIIFQVTYQINFEGSSIKLICSIINKAESQLNDIQLEVNSDSFKISIDNSSIESIPVSSQASFSISATINYYSATYPKLIISYTLENRCYSVNLKLPINFCQFSSPFSSSHEKLWQQWEGLLFACEDCNVSFKNDKDYIPKLLKFGPNVLVLDSNALKEIESGEYLSIVFVKELIFYMIKVNEKENKVHIEVRCNNEKLREIMVKLLIKSISY